MPEFLGRLMWTCLPSTAPMQFGNCHVRPNPSAVRSHAATSGFWIELKQIEFGHITVFIVHSLRLGKLVQMNRDINDTSPWLDCSVHRHSLEQQYNKLVSVPEQTTHINLQGNHSFYHSMRQVMTCHCGSTIYAKVYKLSAFSFELHTTDDDIRNNKSAV